MMPWPVSITSTAESNSVRDSHVNPLTFTKENLDLGKIKYDIYCSPCHGYLGEGDSRLNGQFPNPPTLHSNKVREDCLEILGGAGFQISEKETLLFGKKDQK